MLPKIKTKKAVKKRFKKSGTGKILAKRAGSRHILTSKSRKRKRQKKSTKVLEGNDRQRYLEVLGKG